MVTYLHLLVDQIFGLCETPHKLLPFLFFQSSYLGLVYNVRYLKLLLFELQLELLVHQLCPQQSLLSIEIDEHRQILYKFTGLLLFNDFFNFPLPYHFLLQSDFFLKFQLQRPFLHCELFSFELLGLAVLINKSLLLQCLDLLFVIFLGLIKGDLLRLITTFLRALGPCLKGQIRDTDIQEFFIQFD